MIYSVAPECTIKSELQSHTSDQPKEVNQSKATSSLIPSEMIAKLETILNTAQQNKDQPQKQRQWNNKLAMNHQQQNRCLKRTATEA